MLSDIHIRDFAVIDEISLQIGPGLTVLTGETGAGKSILVGALGLVLGDRADSAAVRTGARRAEVNAVFDICGDRELTAWLTGHDLDADGECVVRRVVGRDGRSRAWINGASVTLRTLRELGDRLVDIHGQHEHQSLLRRGVQKAILDQLGGHADLAAATATAFDAWKSLRDELDELERSARDREARLDLLRYQLRELDALALEPDEIRILSEEQQRTANTESLAGGARDALALAYENDENSAYSMVSRAARTVRGLVEIDAGLTDARQLLESAEIQLSEAADRLRGYLDTLEVDPVRSEWVENRLGSAHELARKHRVEADELPAHTQILRAELDGLEHADERLTKTQAALDAAQDDYLTRATELAEKRSVAAKKLGEGITSVMRQLGMPGGHFEVRMTRTDPPRFAADGLDSVDFFVAPNPGQAAGPLAKIASGGELSRINLAIQVVAAGAAPLHTMVFDEIDAGIGGGIAEIVGQRLHALGRNSQVLCVTHLAQVASQAHQHVRVVKLTDGQNTRTSLTPLADDEKVEELARMLGGVKITRATRDHAREMIARAQGDAG